MDPAITLSCACAAVGRGNIAVHYFCLWKGSMALLALLARGAASRNSRKPL
jgi:hypothetical protein